MSDEQTAMERSFAELEHLIASIQSNVEIIEAHNGLGRHTKTIGDISQDMERIADLLTIAKNSHTIALIDLPFIVPLLQDISLQILTDALAEAGTDTLSKMLCSCSVAFTRLTKSKEG